MMIFSWIDEVRVVRGIPPRERMGSIRFVFSFIIVYKSSQQKLHYPLAIGITFLSAKSQLLFCFLLVQIQS